MRAGHTGRLHLCAGFKLFRAAGGSYHKSWMKAPLSILLIFVLGVIFAGAMPLESGDDDADGWLEDGVYTNEVYSFHVKTPAGWQVASDENRQAYAAELNKGSKSDARVFLMMFRPAQTPGDTPDMIVIAAARTGVTAGVSRSAAMAFFKAQKKSKGTEVIRPASPFLFGGLLVAREDSHIKAENGREQYMANLLIAVRDRMISFQAYSPTRSGMEQDVDTIAAATEFQPDWVARSAKSTQDLPPQRARVSQDSLMALAETKVRPELPDSMTDTPVNVTIDMHVLVSSEGTVEKIWVFEGPPQLTWPAVQAMSKWKFRPYMADGKAVPVEGTITLGFQ